MHIRTLLFILFAVTISSCEKYINIPIPEESNKVVLNLLMNRDSLMMARLTLSGRLNGTQDLAEITNATVNLYENEIFKETLVPYRDLINYKGYYRSKTVAKPGATYK